MFTPARRSAIIDRLLARARADPRVAGAARTGSAAAGTADRWSDIDLFLGLTEITGPVLAALPAGLDRLPLVRALDGATTALITELRALDTAPGLEAILLELAAVPR